MKTARILFIITELSVEPLGLMILSSELKLCGHSIDIHKFKNEQLLRAHLHIFNPDIIAISMTTGGHIKLLEVAREVRKINKNIKIVAGGSHVTYFPDVQKEDCLDYIIRGEADFAFPKLVQDLMYGTVIKKKDCSILALPVDLDTIPFPDRNLVYMFPEFRDNPVRNVMTSRGCPFNCSYCYAGVYRELYKGQNIVRYRSAQNVISECKELVSKYPTKMIFFADDEFSMDIKRLQEMKDLYLKEVNIPFHCQVRIDVLNEERIKILKEMGCYSITFAIECGNEEMRKRILNRNISTQRIIDGAKLLKKYGIKFRAENMIGLPDETFANVLETLNLNIKVKPTYAWVSLYQPFPNTKLGEYCKTQKLFDGNSDVIQAAFTEDTVLLMSEKDKRRIVNMQRLFSLVVAFPVLKYILNVLLNLNITSIYTKYRNIWKKYNYKKLFIGVK